MKSPKIKRKFLVSCIALLITVTTTAQAQAPEKKIVVKKPVTVKVVELNVKSYAQEKLKDYKWDNEQFSCLKILWTKESNWNPKSDNPQSTAFGIAQMLNEKSTDPKKQIHNGLRYIEHRYGNPCNAWKFWRSHYWY